MPISPAFFVLFSLLFLGLIQLFYYLFFFSRLALYKKDKFKRVEVIHPISIIVCAFNEEANLKKNLPNLLSQNYLQHGKPFFEVLVVNDNSQDDSFYVLNEMKKKYEHLHVVNLTQDAKLIPGKKFPLSMGVKSARFEHLVLTDADCVPASKDWLLQMANGFSKEKEIVVGYSPYAKHTGWLNKKIRFETAHSAMQYLTYALAKLPYMGVGRNLAYKRELFNQNKGFSSHHHIISGDDDLFINQVATASNVEICINPNSFTLSEPKRTQEEWHYQKKRHLSTGTFYKTKHQLLLGAYAFSHFAFWINFVACLFFPKIIFFACCVFAVRWLVQWFIFQLAFTKLQAQDLINYIWLFDIWLFFYNIKSIPSIFIKQKLHWK